MSYAIASNDFHRAGAASRSIKEHLKRIGADAEAIRCTMIAAYEAEMNVVIHSVGGRLEASLTDSRIDVDVVDDGPGIPDVEQAMVEGFSTASAEARALGFGAGMGLPNIRRNSDRLRVTSRMGEGTRVSFTICLKPGSAVATRVISLSASADKCRDCRACLTACPTQAMRVRAGRPSVLEHLCIDCTDCIAACTSQALMIRDEISSLDDVPNRKDMLLVVPPALLTDCGTDHPPASVLAALQELGFADVIISAPFEQALRDSAAELADEESAAPSGDAAGARPAPRPKPVIVPSCPAVVNLIELRFPSLVPHLAPFDSPLEAVQAACGDRPVAYVVSCPSQRSALLLNAQGDENGGVTRLETDASAAPRTEYVSPEVIRQAAMVVLTGGGAAPVTPPATVGAYALPACCQADPERMLTVTGMRHVIAVLEQIENGLLDDLDVLDPYACDGGCFGSPLFVEDSHVAARRWNQGRAAVEATLAGGATTEAARTDNATHPSTATARHRPFVARPGIRLDDDMSRAIQKLAQLQAVILSLPGKDCGTCGAPSCAALAEDVVMGRAGVDLCPYISSKED